MNNHNEMLSKDQTFLPNSTSIRIVDGVIQNLPEIIGAIKEVYSLHKREKVFNQVIQFKIDELKIDSENFKILVHELTILSKTQNSDNEIKVFYKDMIKVLFDMFVINRRNSVDISNFLNKW